MKEKKDLNNEVDEKITEEEVAEESVQSDICDEDLNESDNLSGEIDSLKTQLIRLQADFTNFKKRAQKREQDSVNLGVEKFAEVLFPVVDNFDIALSHIEDKNIYDGVKMIYDQVIETFRNVDINVMESDGAVFDPNLHYAVMMEEKDGVESGIITETLKKGFMLGDKVIRPAMVKVSK